MPDLRYAQFRCRNQNASKIRDRMDFPAVKVGDPLQDVARRRQTRTANMRLAEWIRAQHGDPGCFSGVSMVCMASAPPKTRRISSPNGAKAPSI